MSRWLVFLPAVMLTAQVREVAPYRYGGDLEGAARSENRLALPSLKHRRPPPIEWLRFRPTNCG